MNQVEAMQLISDFESGRYPIGYEFSREQVSVLVNSGIFLGKMNIIPITTICESEFRKLMHELKMPSNRTSTQDMRELISDVRTVRKLDLVNKLVAKNLNAYAVLCENLVVNFIYPVNLCRNASDYQTFAHMNPDLVNVFASQSPHPNLVESLRQYKSTYIVDLDRPVEVENMRKWLGIV